MIASWEWLAISSGIAVLAVTVALFVLVKTKIDLESWNSLCFPSFCLDKVYLLTSSLFLGYKKIANDKLLWTTVAVCTRAHRLPSFQLMSARKGS